MDKPILAGCIWLPRDQFNARAIMKQYTVKYWPVGEELPIPVKGYRLEQDFIGVPRQHGMKLISDVPFEDCRSDGSSIVVSRKPKLWEAQVPFVADMLAAAQSDFPDFMSYAMTGFGKSICALAVAAELKRTVLVIVDQERLMDQWAEYARVHLGFTIEDIGVVRGSMCDYRDRKMVIGMVQSLSQRDYPDEFYEWPGVVIIDECHIAGAPVFSKALMLFPARVRFGISATPDRRDALDKLLKWNLGEIEARLEQKHQQSRVYYIESQAVVSWYANEAKLAGRYLTELAANAERNRLLTDAIIWLWKTGRDVLIVSDRIEQLCNLMALCRARAVTEEDMGLYARYREEWVYTKNPTPRRIPKNAGPDYVPMHWTTERKKMRSEDLQDTIDNARLIFATKAMFSKGVDVPRLSAGVDCTPQARVVQVHGRILRTAKDKKLPIWITLRDVYSFRAENQFLSRLKDYVHSNAEVYEFIPDKGVRKQDVQELQREVRQRIAVLKTKRIINTLDGGYTIS
jgi:superfamily II DNA or RNA helicase